MSFSLHHPSSVAEAVALARQFGETARFVAGGTDLIIQINRKRQSPAHLIDLGGLPGLAGIEETPHGFRIGALTTHKTMERHPPFRDRCVRWRRPPASSAAIRSATSAPSAAIS